MALSFTSARAARQTAVALAGALLATLLVAPADSSAAELPAIVADPDPDANPLSSTLYYGIFGAPEPTAAPPGVGPSTLTGALFQSLGVTSGNVRVTNQPGFQNEISIAVSPVDEKLQIAGANDYGFDGAPQQGVFNSVDGGKTWNRQPIPGTKLLAPMGGDPALAFGPDGTGYYVGIAFNGGSYLTLSKSVDGGRTWSPAKAIVGARSGGLWDKPMMAVDPTSGAIYVTWTMFGAGEIMFVKSTDGGATWNAPGKVLATGTNQFSLPVPGLDGRTIHVIYLSCYNGGGLTGFKCARITTSTDGGATWSAPAKVMDIQGIRTNPGYRYIPYPGMAIDRSSGAARGTLYVAWVSEGSNPLSAAGVGTKSDVWATSSKDGGATWTPAVRVNTELDQNLAAYMPWVAVNGKGTVGVAWVNFNTQTRDNAASMAQSKDGQAWIEVPHATGAGKSSVAFFWGDYNGLAAGAQAFYPGWTDGRDGNTEAYTARVNDVFLMTGL